VFRSKVLYENICSVIKELGRDGLPYKRRGHFQRLHRLFLFPLTFNHLGNLLLA